MPQAVGPPVPRLRAAVFAAARHEDRNGRETLVQRLARLKAVASARGYEVVLERSDDAPAWKAHHWAYDLLEAADAGTIHALFIEDERQLGPSMRQANWFRHRFERAGAWIVQTAPKGVAPSSPVVPMATEVP